MPYAQQACPHGNSVGFSDSVYSLLHMVNHRSADCRPRSLKWRESCLTKAMIRVFAALVLIVASPAIAADESVAVPEPSNWALFALGVAGVIIGRFGLRSRRRDDRSGDDPDN